LIDGTISDPPVNPSPANPYPSSIDVAGLSGPLRNVTVTLHRVTDDFADDIDILLVAPQGQNLILISDAAVGANDEVTVIFDDAGSVISPNDTGWANGVANTTVTRVPINYDPTDVFPPTAPQPPYTSPDPATSPLLSAFGGINPNGRWQLFVVDDSLGSDRGGVIAGGWSLDIQVLGPDLQITKTNNRTEVAPGEAVTYTIVVTNPDAQLGAIGATVIDQFPSNLLNGAFTATGTGGAKFTPSGTGGINDLVNLPPRSSITYTVTGIVDPNSKEGFGNVADVVPPPGIIDPDPENNTAFDFDTLVPRADVTVTITAAGAGARQLVYTVTVRNLGPSHADNVVFSDLLPATTQFLGQAQTSGPAFVLGNKGNQVINQIDVLPAGATATFTVLVAGPRGRTVVNTGNVATDTNDPVLANNTASVTALIGTKNQRWLAQVFRDLIHREISRPALNNGLKFLSQPGNPRALRVRYVQQLTSGLLYKARVAHDVYWHLLYLPTNTKACTEALHFLTSGGTTEGLKALLIGGQKYFNKRGKGTQEGWAAAAFKSIFGRPIDAAGTTLINNLLAKGLSRTAVAQTLLNTAAAQVRLVQSWFSQFLQRQPTPAELNRFTQQLANGVPDEQIISTIIASGEYYQKV
jgi:uncharacterized repeat protein (TIGR01451 family)